MTIQKILSSFNDVDPTTYVGAPDRLWYDVTTNTLRVSDGVTPGGKSVGNDQANEIVPGNPARASFVGVNTFYTSSSNLVTSCKLAVRMQIGIGTTSVQMVDVSAAKDTTATIAYTVANFISSASGVTPVTITASVNADNKIIAVADTHGLLVHFTYHVVEFGQTV
jgi:hypothetical protein